MRSGAVRRFGSYFIDDLFMSLFELVFIFISWGSVVKLIEMSYDLENELITMKEYLSYYWDILGPIQLTALIVMIVFGAGYMIILPYYWDGQTIGRKVVGVKLKMMDGSKLTFGKIFIREFVFKIMWWIVTLGIGSIIDFIMVGLREDKLAIRDIVTKTEIVDVEGESVKEEYYDF